MGWGVGGGKYIYIYEEIIVQGDKYKRERNINIKYVFVHNASHLFYL